MKVAEPAHRRGLTALLSYLQVSSGLLPQHAGSDIKEWAICSWQSALLCRDLVPI